MAEPPSPKSRRPPPLPRDEVAAIIRHCLERGTAVPTKHFRGRGFQRSYTLQDALNVLEFGQVSSDPPEWNERAKGWTYQVHGPDLEGDVFTVVVGIGARKDSVWLVTAY